MRHSEPSARRRPHTKARRTAQREDGVVLSGSTEAWHANRRHADGHGPTSESGTRLTMRDHINSAFRAFGSTAILPLILLPAVPANANLIASITRIDGTAIISNGTLYSPASEGTRLKPGDRLIVLDGGQATVHFSDHCHYLQTDQNILDIVEQSTCELGQGGEYRPDLTVVEPPEVEIAISTGVEEEVTFDFSTLQATDPLQTSVVVEPVAAGAVSGTAATGAVPASGAAGAASAAGIAGAAGGAGAVSIGLSMPALTALAITGGFGILEATVLKTSDEPQPVPLSQ